MKALRLRLKLFLQGVYEILAAIHRKTMMAKYTFFLIAAMMPVADAASAWMQDGPAAPVNEQAKPIPPTPPKTVVPPKKPLIKVTDVFKSGHADKEDKDRAFAGIGEEIIVKVNNLQELVRKSKCHDANDSLIESGNCTPKKIMLYLDDRQLDGISAKSLNIEEGILRFSLERAVGTNDKIWSNLLGAPPIGGKFFKRPTKVSVGLEDDYGVPTDIRGDKFNIVRIRESWFWFCSVSVILLLYFLSRLAVKSDILRDSGPVAKDATGNDIPKPYSLARCQMAFWFFWVITSFVYLWLITGAYDIITTEALALIGIGAATALGSASIDSSKTEEVAAQQKSLEAEKLNLANALNLLHTSMNAVPTPANLTELTQNQASLEARLSLVNNQLTNLSVSTGPKSSEGWQNDILKDNTGISFHRFQIVVWTLVLGILFVFSVWNRLSMPEFGATLLALQGISAATYIGFKIPEKQV